MFTRIIKKSNLSYFFVNLISQFLYFSSDPEFFLRVFIMDNEESFEISFKPLQSSPEIPQSQHNSREVHSPHSWSASNSRLYAPYLMKAYRSSVHESMESVLPKCSLNVPSISLLILSWVPLLPYFYWILDYRT